MKETVINDSNFPAGGNRQNIIADEVVFPVAMIIASLFLLFLFWASVRNPPIPHYSERIDAEYGEQMRDMGITRIGIYPPMFGDGTTRATISYTADGEEVRARVDVEQLGKYIPTKIYVHDDGAIIKGRSIKRAVNNYAEREAEWRKIASVIEDSMAAVRNSESARREWES